MRFKYLIAATAALLVLGGTVAFSAATASAASPENLFGAAVPAVKADADAGAVELGVQFRPAVDGTVSGVRFYKGTGNTGTHSGSVWSGTGTRLVTKTFTGETSTGWQTVTFTTPLAVTAGSTYTASYFAPRGHYAVNNPYTWPRVSGNLTGVKGVYRYGSTSGYPTSVYETSNYWVDVVFTATVVAPPTTTNATPTPTTMTTPPTTTTSSPPSTGCAASPSSCGYPDATNTGPAAGTIFIKVPSQQTSGDGWVWDTNYGAVKPTTAGAILSGLDITGGVLIDVPNVTVTNSIVRNCGLDGDVIMVRYRSSDSGLRGSGAKIIHNTLGASPGCTERPRSGVRDVYGEAPNLDADSNNISGTGNGVSTEVSGIISNNWVHNLGHAAGDHHSGISTHGGATGLTWQHNTVLLYGMPQPGGGGVSGALTVDSDFGYGQNTTVQDNLISGGAYTTYGGYNPSSNIKFLNNRFVCGAWDYGPSATFYPNNPGNEWAGNYCDQDGSPVLSGN